LVCASQSTARGVVGLARYIPVGSLNATPDAEASLQQDQYHVGFDGKLGR